MRRIEWTETARTDVRQLDIPTAMRIFAAVQRFAESGVRFVQTETVAIQIKRVLHRSEAYR